MGVRYRTGTEVDSYSPLRAGDFLYSRVQVGVVASVLPDAGTMTVVIERTGRPFVCAIPGFVNVAVAGCAWDRFVPLRGTRCRVGFDLDDHPVFLGWALYETLDGDTSARANEEGHAAVLTRARAGQAGLRMFRALREGEFDRRSIGGAYIFGGATGQLLLAGGNVTLDLSPQRDEGVGEADRWRLGARSSYLSVGSIRRRVFPTDTQDTVIPGGTVVELAAETLTLDRATIDAGDVRDAAGLAVPGVTGPVLLRAQAESVTGVSYGGIETDAGGSTVVSGAVAVGLDAPLVSLGASSAADTTDAVAYGTITQAAIQTLATSLSTLAGIVTGLLPLVPASTAIVSQLATMQAALAPLQTIVCASPTVRTT